VTAPNPGPLTLEGTRTWILGVERVAIVDPGPDDPGHLERVAQAVGGRPVAALCLTHSHPDHSAAVAEAADRWGRVHASSGTLARLSLDGVTLAGGDEIPLGARHVLEIHPSPGHSGDHLAFFYLPARDLLTGDLVLGRGSSMVAHPDGSVSAYLESLERLAGLQPARLLPGHGPVVVDALERLAAYALHRRERTEQVRQALAAGARSLSELRATVYGMLPAGLVRAADLSLLAHLEHLRERGHEVPAIR
jgi:glyoxylase-like metal-dependent hydrolase (beta-lactamase superfamily II)